MDLLHKDFRDMYIKVRELCQASSISKQATPEHLIAYDLMKLKADRGFYKFTSQCSGLSLLQKPAIILLHMLSATKP